MKQGWEIKKLGEVCDFQGGSQPPKEEWIDEPREGYVRMLQIRDFTQSRSFDIEYVKESNRLKYCNEDDVLLGRYGASVGKVLTGLAGAYNVAIMKTMPNKDLLNKSYFKYFLESPSFQVFLQQASTMRAAQAGFSKEDIQDFTIPVPPREEQERIVAELDCLSGVIERKREQLRELDALAQSIFYQMFGDPITNEKGWEVKKLGEVCNKITDGTHDTPERLSSGVKFITGKHIRAGVIDYDNSDYVLKEIHDEIYARCNPEYGDVLYTNIGANLGTAAINIVRYEFSMKNVALLKVNNDIINGYYLQSYLNDEEVKNDIINSFSNGGAQKFLSLKMIAKISIPIPSLALQQQFADKIEKIEQQKELIKKSIEETENLFNARMEYYFN